VAVRALREVALFGFYAVVAIILTWPLAANLPTAVSDLGDPLLNAWILDWNCYALTHKPLHLFNAPIFFPAKFPWRTASTSPASQSCVCRSMRSDSLR
jgi:hypothetical protein